MQKNDSSYSRNERLFVFGMIFFVIVGFWGAVASFFLGAGSFTDKLPVIGSFLCLTVFSVLLLGLKIKRDSK